MAFGERNSRRYEVQAGPKKGGKHLWAARFFGPVSFFLPLLMCLSNAPLSLIRGKEGREKEAPREKEGKHITVWVGEAYFKGRNFGGIKNKRSERESRSQIPQKNIFGGGS